MIAPIRPSNPFDRSDSTSCDEAPEYIPICSLAHNSHSQVWIVTWADQVGFVHWTPFGSGLSAEVNRTAARDFYLEKKSEGHSVWLSYVSLSIKDLE